MKKILSQILITLCLTAVLSLPYFAMAEVSGSGGGSGSVSCTIDQTTGVSSCPTGSTGGNALDKLKHVGSDNGPYAAADNTSMSAIVGNIINTALSLLGVLFIILIVVYGYKWMSAGGDEKTVEGAKTAIKNAVIGLVVTMAAYAIWGFILQNLLQRVLQ